MFDDWKPNPFLHIDADRIYNPLTDRAIVSGDPMYAPLRGFLDGGTVAEGLSSEGWIVRTGDDVSHNYRLKIVSLEMMTACNQKCYFCPVSIAPREDTVMAESMFTRIVDELKAFRPALESIFLQSYNEPTLDRKFVEHCHTLFDAGLPVAVLTNGSGLTPAKVDALMSRGRLRYVCVNLSTLDRERYRADRGGDHLEIVLRNLEYVKNRELAEQMNIAVLGTGDAIHQNDFESIKARFAGTRFDVQHHVVMDRAGWLDVGTTAHNEQRTLAGCDNLGSRPIQHLHITPAGKCVLCCEDYDENYVVGDLATSSIVEVMGGARLAEMRRWIYGLENAPDDFICRRCVFARTT